MKKVKLKRILGLFIFIFVFSCILLECTNVYAAGDSHATWCSNAKKGNNKWEKDYGLKWNLDGSTLTIKLDKSAIQVDEKATNGIKSKVKDKMVKEAKFKITKISVRDVGSDKNRDIPANKVPTGELSYSKTITINLADDCYTVGMDYTVYLEPVGDYVDPRVKSWCIDKDKNFTYSFSMELGDQYPGAVQRNDKLPIEWITDTSEAQVSPQIDCTDFEKKYSKDGAWSDGSAKSKELYYFCLAKSKATPDKELPQNGTYAASDVKTFKCDWRQLVAATSLKGENYYTNQSYLFGTVEKEGAKVTYTYNYENGKTASDTDTCMLQCDEAVIVDYGPPVASKAGVCFEYKVRVTSIVNCYRKNNEGYKVPRTGTLCTPVPHCASSTSNMVWKQGGPSEEFDKCVVNCDGGKYTEKCSNKCYNKVYKNSGNTKTSGNEIVYGEKVGVSSGGCASSGNNRYCYDGTQIYWKNGANSGYRDCNSGNHVSGNWYTCSTDSRWHKNNSWGTTGGYTQYSATGIPRTPNCSDTCTWIGCDKEGDYLNEDQRQKDLEENKAKYEKFKTDCEAAAKCASRTNTTQFTISFDYNNGKEDKTVHYPYETDAKSITKIGEKASKYDELRSLTGDNKQTEPDKDTTTIIDYSTKGYDGCYRNGKANDWYQTEWSFPGTWMNNKNGDISYTVPKPVTGWAKNPYKFCLPFNAKDVNQQWWTYYFAKKYSDEEFSYDDKPYQESVESCNTEGNGKTKKCDYSKFNMSQQDFEKKYAKNIKYNIKASTTSFGLLGWNIEIQCFYALYKNFTCLASDAEQGKEIKDSCESGYKVRSVDLNNLFPGKDGAKVTYDKTGRSPGFNWSEHADMYNKQGNNTAEYKNGDYTSQPSEYTKWVQKKGYDIYSDDNVDYGIELTKDKMAKILEKSKGHNYTSYDGSSTMTDTFNYRSNLFRGGVLSGDIYPSDTTLKCNNISAGTRGTGYSAPCQTNFK